MTVQIRLTPYDYTAELPRTFIMTTLEGSLLAQALECEPDAIFIPLPNAIVTPRVIDGLVEMATLETPKMGPREHHRDFEAAGSYLNLPWLQSYSDSLYNTFPDKQDVNSPHNRALVEQVIREDRHHLYAYLLGRDLRATDNDLKMAIHRDARRVFRALRPSAWSGALVTAIQTQQTAIIDIILNEMEVGLSTLTTAILVAIRGGHIDIAKRLLQYFQSRDDYKSTELNRYLHEAIRENSVELVEFLLSQAGVDPAIPSFTTNETPIIMAASRGHAKIVALLLKDPRVDPSVEGNRALQAALNATHTETINLLLNDPRANPNYRLHRDDDALKDTCIVM